MVGFFPGVFCESLVFTEVRRRSRSVGGGRVYSGVTEVTSEVPTEVVIVTERLRCLAEAVSDGGQVYLQALLTLL